VAAGSPPTGSRVTVEWPSVDRQPVRPGRRYRPTGRRYWSPVAGTVSTGRRYRPTGRRYSPTGSPVLADRSPVRSTGRR